MPRLLVAALVVLLGLGATAPVDAARPAHWRLGDRPLRLGDQGHDVQVLQRVLARDGLRVAVDGRFGALTRAAVQRFQRAVGLPVVGVVGPRTLAALRHPLAVVPASGAADGRGGVASPPPAPPPPPTAPPPGTPAPAPVPPGSPTATGGTPAVPAPGAPASPPPSAPGPLASAVLGPDGLATAPAGAPGPVVAAIAAANRIARLPYRWGGGHGRWEDSGYDCSGSVSFALHGAGLLDATLDSTGLESWGAAGVGRWITVYANPVHAYAVIAGLRFDTSGQALHGTRWQVAGRSGAGFVVRHPAGL